jgi:cytochrome c oxidase subunit 4
MNKIPKKYILSAVWLALIILHFTIFGCARLDWGIGNVIFSMTLAVIQMILILLFFMRLFSSGKLTWIFAAAGFFWLLIMFTLVASDYFTRTWH